MTTVSDDFNRANGAIGANWTTIAGFSNNLTITSNQVGTVGSNDGAYHNGFTSSTGDVFAQIDEITSPANYSIGLIFSDVSGNNYQAQRYWTGALVFTRNGVTIGSGYAPGSSVPGTLRMEKSGAVLTVKLNGSVIDAYTDGSPYTIVNVGMACVVGDASLRGDNWSGGDLVTAFVLDEDGEWIIVTQTW